MSLLDNNPWESSSPVSNPGQALQPTSTSSGININPTVIVKKRVLDIQIWRIFTVWPYIILSSVFFLVMGWLYLRYADRVYETSTTVVLENNAEMKLDEALFTTRDPLNNQIALLQSPAVAKRVVEQLGLQNRAIVKGRVKDKELFDELNWKILASRSGKPLYFEIYPNANGFQWKADSAKGSAHWGDTVLINGNAITCLSNGVFSKNSVIQCFNTDVYEEAEELSRLLTVKTSKESNVITVSIKDELPVRAVAILTNLIDAYNLEAKIAKSRSLQQSLQFIQERLYPVAGELDSIETAMAQFKSARGFIGNETKGGIYLGQSVEYDNKLKEITLQKAILNAAESFLKDPKTKPDQLAIPGVNDANLNAGIVRIQQLKLERDKLAQVLAVGNPKLEEADRELMNARLNMDLQLENYRHNIQLMEASVIQNRTLSESKLKSTPADEKTLLEQGRMQNIKQSLFLLLLEKREETAIGLAGVSVETSILAPAKMPKDPISPQREQVLIGSFLIGLFLPLIITTIKEIMNNKVTSKQLLQLMTTVPVISEVDEADKEDSEIIVTEKDRSVFGEQIRTLRANMTYYAGNKKPFFILITSSMSGEGKSFISGNLAASFALSGKKTALLEFDLRKPKLQERFGLPKGKGIVNVLAGESKPEDIPVQVMPNYPLFLFQSGPVPPNPSELMTGDNMQVLKKHLSENYDVIILDTPPYALVADAQLLESWSDISLFMTRFNRTLRDQVSEIEETKQRGLFKNMAIVLNGIQMTGYYGYRYGYYGAKRKYGYNYYYYDKKKQVKGTKNKY